jgi:hypothetical protein
MTGRLKDLAQDIFCDAGIKTTNVESTLVRFGCDSAREGTSTGRRQDRVLINRRHRGSDGGRDRVRVGWDVQRRRRHMRRVSLAVLVAVEPRSTSVGLRRRRRELCTSRGGARVCHYDESRERHVDTLVFTIAERSTLTVLVAQVDKEAKSGRVLL